MAAWKSQQDAALGPAAPPLQQQQQQQRLHLLEEEGTLQQALELDGGEAGAQQQQLEEEGEQQPMVVDGEAAAGQQQEQPGSAVDYFAISVLLLQEKEKAKNLEERGAAQLSLQEAGMEDVDAEDGDADAPVPLAAQGKQKLGRIVWDQLEWGPAYTCHSRCGLENP